MGEYKEDARITGFNGKIRFSYFVTPKCESCKHFLSGKDEEVVQGSHKYLYRCIGGSYSAATEASKIGNPYDYDNCKSYEQDKRRSSSASGSGSTSGGSSRSSGKNYAEGLADAAGAGIFVDVAKVGFKAGKALFKAGKDAMDKAKQEARDKIEKELNSVQFGDSKQTIKQMEKLRRLWQTVPNAWDIYTYEERKQIGGNIVDFLDEGVKILRDLPDMNEKKLEKYQAMVQKARVEKYLIKDVSVKGQMTNAFKQGMPKIPGLKGDDTPYYMNLAVVDGVYLDGSKKFLLKEVASLAGVLDAMFGLLGKAKKISLLQKADLVNNVYQKINFGLEALKNKEGINPSLAPKYQMKLFDALFALLKPAFSKITKLTTKGQDLRDTIDATFLKIDEMLPVVRGIKGFKDDKYQTLLEKYKTKRGGI